MIIIQYLKIKKKIINKFTMVSFRNFRNNAILSNIKIIKFISQVNPDPFAASVIFHAPMDGFVTDRTGNVNVTPNGDLTYDAGPFVGTNGYVYDTRSSNKYLTYDPFPIDGDFTLEYWGMITDSVTSGQQLLYGNYGLENGIAFQHTSGSTIRFAFINASSTGVTTVGSISFLRNEWHFITITREDDLWKFYLNGNLVSQTTSNRILDTAHGMRIGIADITSASYDPGSSTGFLGTGRIFDLRITEAIRYTDDFTPPDSPFPRIN